MQTHRWDADLLFELKYEPQLKSNSNPYIKKPKLHSLQRSLTFFFAASSNAKKLECFSRSSCKYKPPKKTPKKGITENNDSLAPRCTEPIRPGSWRWWMGLWENTVWRLHSVSATRKQLCKPNVCVNLVNYRELSSLMETLFAVWFWCTRRWAGDDLW